MTAVLTAHGLAVASADGARLVAPLDLAVAAGEIVSLIGESGAGKSLICGAIAATLAPGLAISGRIAIGGADVSDPARRRRLWSHRIFLLPQEPWTALAPARRVLAQTADTPRLAGASSAAARGVARGWLHRLGLRPDQDGARRPAALSGGMAQRAAVAAALGAPATLMLVDEPTKGLDASRRDQVRDGLALLRQEGRAIVLVTHDLALVRALGGRVIVLRGGQVVEEGPAAKVLTTPSHPFTRALIDAEPAHWAPPATVRATPRLEVENLALGAGRAGPVLAEGISFAIGSGEVLGLWGDSGSGKTTLGDTVLGLRPVRAGRIRWFVPPRPGERQKLYQDPGAMFAPWRPVRATLADALAGTGQPRHGLDRVIAPLLERLRLPPALLDRRPDAVSGGELQRLALARAWLRRPTFLFADEPTSRLDPLTQREVAGLLAEIAADGTAVLLASHDPALLRALAGRIIHLPCPDPTRAANTAQRSTR